MSFDRGYLETFLTGVAQTRALVVGDLMLDEYIWGAVDRISPEAPVQIVEVKRKDLRLGGAGNVINNLLTLHCRRSAPLDEGLQRVDSRRPWLGAFNFQRLQRP